MIRIFRKSAPWAQTHDDSYILVGAGEEYTGQSFQIGLGKFFIGMFPSHSMVSENARRQCPMGKGISGVQNLRELLIIESRTRLAIYHPFDIRKD